jgi:ADP-ribose pyrophosphatase
VLSRTVRASGHVQSFVTERVDLGGAGGVVTRDFAEHPGSVGIVVLDAAGRVLLQRQYRHPVRASLWEPPAGIRDVAGEPPLVTGQRELGEEADLRAADWRELIDFYTTPGGCSEELRLYLARDLTPVPAAERFTRQEEETDLEPAWVDLDEAARLCVTGALKSPSAVVGVLAAWWASRQPGGLDALPVAR